jgi:hypothetical protein
MDVDYSLKTERCYLDMREKLQDKIDYELSNIIKDMENPTQECIDKIAMKMSFSEALKFSKLASEKLYNPDFYTIYKCKKGWFGRHVEDFIYKKN